MSAATSVVIPYHNAAAFLPEALASVRAQARPAREVIVVDDGSAEPPPRPAGWGGPPVTVIRTPNRGPSAARNTGVAAATGEFVAFLDADDTWHPDKLARQEDAFAADPAAVLCYTRCAAGEGLYAFGPYPPPGVSDDELLLVLWHDAFFPTSAVSVRREAFAAAGGFREDLHYGEDLELWLRLLERGRFAQVPEPLTCYRRHPGQVTRKVVRRVRGMRAARAAMIERHGRRLAAAGLAGRDAWAGHRAEVLGVYYRRDFAAARPLLWDLWLSDVRDLTALKYLVLSCLPAGWVERLRGRVVPASDRPAPAPGANPALWAAAVRRVRPAAVAG